MIITPYIVLCRGHEC